MATVAHALKDALKIHNVKVHTAAGDVEITNEGVCVVNKTSGAATQVTLPPGPKRGDFCFVIDGKGDAHDNPITVVGADSETIEGKTYHIIKENFGSAVYEYNATEWVVASGGAKDAGTVVAADGLTVAETVGGGVHVTTFIFDAFVLETTDNGTAGHGGSQQIYDFPQGAILILAASQNWESMTVDGTGLPGDSEIDIGVGTTAATSAMGSLTTTTQNIVNKDDITFSSSVSAVHQYIDTVSGGNKLAGQATAADAYLNLACTAATGDADGTITLTGTVVVTWLNLGKQSS